MSPSNDDLSSFSLSDLFRLETETQAALLAEGLLELERDPNATHWLESLMRAAHSLKGAAQIVERADAVRLTHVMEDTFVAAQQGEITLPPARIDILLRGVDLLSQIAQVEESDIQSWHAQHESEIETFLQDLAQSIATSPTSVDGPATAPPTPDPVPVDEPISPPGVSEIGQELVPVTPSVLPPQEKSSATVQVEDISSAPPPSRAEPQAEAPFPPSPVHSPPPNTASESKAADASNRSIRISSDNLNRLMGLAGELVVTSRWAETFTAELLRLKQVQQEVTKALNIWRESQPDSDGIGAKLAELQGRQAHSQQILNQRLEDLESFDRRFVNLSSRLYQEVLECRMRPFSDGVQGFSRLMRDVARSLGKSVRFEIGGEDTLVDRDILERIEAPLSHLLKNALDHGIESPEQRRDSGKPETASVRLEAFHNAGMLIISVTDDGGGIDVEKVRRAVVNRRLSSAEVAQTMSDAELMEFLFLPGFSMKEGVTEISGRGVGLDAVQTMVREVGGTVRISSQLGQGTQFHLQLPLTLSVIRTLLVEIAGEPYAFPLARITGALKVGRDEIETIQGRQHFVYRGQQIALVTAHQILELDSLGPPPETLSVIVLGSKAARYGVAVDRFLREQELVVRPLDPRLGKVQDISAAALMPDRTPVLIIDVEDLIRSIENLASGGRVTKIRQDDSSAVETRKRVLVVDDSLTVRELERKLLDGAGYQVEVAVDGMDGWNAARVGKYDLVITDVDMPRMDGIELVRLIKQDARLQSLPVMIVSYKDREEDRRRGLEAGADYYLTKGSFHDESLLGAVTDLIGEARE